jgi:iron complex transport system substrate-binding protein
MRIVSLLPSATEILCALGLDDEIIGVSHDCDFPPSVKERPVVIHSRIPLGTDSADIDRLVRGFVERGESVYTVDGRLLRELAPDLIVTQDLCLVCAASPHDLAGVLAGFEYQPRVLSLNPRNLTDVWADILQVAAATSREAAGQKLLKSITQRLQTLRTQLDPESSRPRVAFLEWMNPFYVGGHWVPEMIALAGGEDVFGELGQPSFRIDTQDLIAAAPDVLILAPCGYDAAQAAREYTLLKLPAGWEAVPAVRDSRVYAFEANSYASRPGPRLVTGTEALAKILHPSVAVGDEATRAFRNTRERATTVSVAQHRG